jgi:hypothetical protein
MKKTVTGIILCFLFISNGFSEITVTKMWERSRAQNNAAANVKIDISTTQKTIAVANDTIFLADNNPAQIYCYSAANGDYLTSFTSPSGDNMVLADKAGHICTTGPEGATYFNLSIRQANNTFTSVSLGATSKLAFPALYSDTTDSMYVFTFVAAAKQIRRYTVFGGIVTAIKTVTITDLHSSYQTRETSVMPVTKDKVIITANLAFSTYVDMNHGDYVFTDLTRIINKNRVYLVQGWTPSLTDYLLAGSFKIYDVTDEKNATIVYTQSEYLGVDARAYNIVTFQAVVKADGVYIYEYSPLNGMAAYKLTDTATDNVEIAKENTLRCFSENGTLTIMAPVGEQVKVYSVTGTLISSIEMQQPIASFDVDKHQLLLVCCGNEVVKVNN